MPFVDVTAGFPDVEFKGQEVGLRGVLLGGLGVVVVDGVTSGVTVIISHIRGFMTPLINTHDFQVGFSCKGSSRSS